MTRHANSPGRTIKFTSSPFHEKLLVATVMPRIWCVPCHNWGACRFPVVEPDTLHTKLAAAKRGLDVISRITNPVAVVAVSSPTRKFDDLLTTLFGKSLLDQLFATPFSSLHRRTPECIVEFNRLIMAFYICRSLARTALASHFSWINYCLFLAMKVGFFTAFVPFWAVQLICSLSVPRQGTKSEKRELRFSLRVIEQEGCIVILVAQ